MSERAFKRWILQPNDWYLYHTFGIFQSIDGYLYRNYGSTITSQVLTSKLSGLDLNEGRARGGDSGVVSATIHWPIAEKMKKSVDTLTSSLWIDHCMWLGESQWRQHWGWKGAADLRVQLQKPISQWGGCWHWFGTRWAWSVCWLFASIDRISVNIYGSHFLLVTSKWNLPRPAPILKYGLVRSPNRRKQTS